MVIGIAIAVLIGGAFVALLTALMRDLLTPLIAAVIGKPDFSASRFTVNGSMFLIGDFISAVISFAVITATVYFFILVPASAILGREWRVEAALDHTRSSVRNA